MVEQGGGGGPQRQKIKHTGRQTGCVLALEIILNISCRIAGTFMQHIYISWEQLLYKCWIMKNPVLSRKQSTVHNPQPPCVQTCTQSHDKHAFLTVQASELAYMSLYIIYLYLVKNKLHNSTNLENCFFKLKMT